MTQLTIYMVEDSPAVRDRFRDMIADIPGIQLIGESDNEAEAVQDIARRPPRLVILDINLREGTGFEVLRQVKALDPAIVVAVVTNFGNIQFRDKCEQLGADYFFDKTKGNKALVELLRGLAVHQAVA